MAMLPGTYLRKRREAADLSIDDVATMLPTEPHVSVLDRANWLRQIEAGEAPIGDNVIKALRFAFAFKAWILRRLEEIRRGEQLQAPQLCRKCACSDEDPCRERQCHWVAQDLCSNCPPDGEPAVEANPAIDDEDPTAAPSPDNDGIEELAA